MKRREGSCRHFVKRHCMSIHAEYLHKKNLRGKSAWIYAALPVTALAVAAGLVTNAWSPVFPVICLFCVLLVTVCKLLIEKRESK